MSDEVRADSKEQTTFEVDATGHPAMGSVAAGEPTSSGRSPLFGSAGEASTPPSEMRYVFCNTEGLRAGWGLLIFLAMLAAIGSLVGLVMHHLYPGGTAAASGKVMTVRRMVSTEALSFGALALVTWVMSRIEGRPVGVYGFGGRGGVAARLRAFFIGLAWGFTFLTALVLALHWFGLLTFTGQQIFGMAALRAGVEWALGFLCVGLLEEYLLRGYLQYTLARGLSGLYGLLFETRHQKALGFWTAAAVLSFVFGFGHRTNPGESPIGLVSAGLVGLIFCLTLWRTGSLWWALGFHAAWDWAQSFVYGVADSGLMVQGHLLGTQPAGRVLWSGGATGPEGSILILPLLAIVAVVVMLTLPLRKSPHPEIAR